MPSQLDVAQAIVDGIDAHPAAIAWSRVGAGASPTEIRVLKERSGGTRKSAVYWLRGAGPGGGAVVAKLAKRDAVALETLVYGTLLPHLRLDAPQFHGSVDDGGPFAWIFLEHIAGERYTPRSAAHRRAAGAWLGELHATAARAMGPETLPDRGPGHFVTWVRLGRDAMVAAAGYPGLTEHETRVAEALCASLDHLTQNWDAVIGTAGLLPSTVVHGDLVRKNLVLRMRAGGLGLVAFDWEKAGWGAPALDLAYCQESKAFAASPCLETYGRTLRAHRLIVDPEAVRRCAAIGTALRCVAGIVWKSASLSPDNLHPMADMAVYGRWLEQAMGAASLGGPRALS